MDTENEIRADENKLKKIYIKAVAALLILLVVIPIGWHYVIGPRDVSKSAELYEMQVYYCFHTYRFAGYANGDVKSGIMLYHGPFVAYYKAKDLDYCIIRNELHERYILHREDKRAEKTTENSTSSNDY